MNTIAKLLKITDEGYILMILEQYVTWCGLSVNTAIDCQKLVSSQFLFNWYLKEIKNLEFVFCDALGCSVDILSLKQTQNLYISAISKICKYYPPKYLFQKITNGDLQTSSKTIEYNLN